MFINLDGLEIMVRMRCEDIRQETEEASKPYKRTSFPVSRRALIWVGGLFVALGMTLEKLGIGQEVYHLANRQSLT